MTLDPQESAPRLPSGSSPVDKTSHQARADARIDVWLHDATLRQAGCNAAPVVLHDLSRSGFRTEWPYLLNRGDRVWLKLPGFYAWSALVVWNTDFKVGCVFETALHPAVFDQIIRTHKKLGR